LQSKDADGVQQCNLLLAGTDRKLSLIKGLQDSGL